MSLAGSMMKRSMLSACISLLCCLCFLCCKQVQNELLSSDPMLAEVYDQKLMLSDVRPLLLDAASEEDSAAQVRNHVEAWVREALLLHEAERNVPVDVNINKLVQDYRASLLISLYENILSKSLLDTVVTEAELKAHYDRNRQQYQLDAPILRCHFIRLRKPVVQKEMFLRLWTSKRPDDLKSLFRYCQANATDYLLKDSTWYRLPDLERLLPERALTGQNLYSGKTLRFYDSESEYYVRIFQHIAAREPAPLSYVGEQARRFILHRRKIELIEKIKADIYTREIDGVHVKIHI